MTWNEDLNAVSRAFNDWRSADTECRAFLRLSTRWSDEGYEHLWQEAEESFASVFDPDHHHGDEHVDMFHNAVDGLWPHDHTWLVEAAVIKDAVTAFEVYLEESAQEVLDTYTAEFAGQRCSFRMSTPKGFESPPWGTLVKAHAEFGSDVDTPQVQWIRRLRHLLTHQRGTLRSQEKLDEFACKIHPVCRNLGFFASTSLGSRVHLGRDRVLAVLDVLTATVRAADTAVSSLHWGPDRQTQCQQVLASLYVAKLIAADPL